MKKLIKNKAQCKLCGDIIESKHRHDFVECKCKKFAVDGGLVYTRRIFDKYEDFIELSEYEEIEEVK
jgi:hypothetical protein